MVCYHTDNGRAVGAAYFDGNTVIKLGVRREFEGLKAKGMGDILPKQWGHTTALLAPCFKARQAAIPPALIPSAVDPELPSPKAVRGSARVVFFAHVSQGTSKPQCKVVLGQNGLRRA